MGQIGRYLVLFGAALALTGVLLLAGEKLGLGKLPGDFVVRKKNGTFYLPLATSLLVSVVLTLIANLLLRRK